MNINISLHDQQKPAIDMTNKGGNDETKTNDTFENVKWQWHSMADIHLIWSAKQKQTKNWK